MNICNEWGIDLSERRMWYAPWTIDKNGDYRKPTEEEIDEIYGISGLAFHETLLYFEQCGGNTDKLIKLLNDKVIDERFKVTRDILIDKTRWYNNEYYFYFVMFTKKVLERYDFHFGDTSVEQLSRYHSIYEKGYIDKIPWGFDEKGNLIGDYSSENFCKVYNYISDSFKNKDDIFDDLIFFMNCVLVKQKRKFGISYFFNNNFWFNFEILAYYYAFIIILTNDNNILYKSGKYGISDVLGTMAQVYGTVRNVYRNIPSLAAKFNKVTKYDVMDIKRNSCIVRFKLNLYDKEINKYILSITRPKEQLHIALFETIPSTISNAKMKKFIRIKSLIKGDDCFEGKFVWKNSIDKSRLIEIIINTALFSLLAVSAIYSLKPEHICFFIILLLSNISYFLFKKILKIKKLIKKILNNLEVINQNKDELTANLQSERDSLEKKVQLRTMELVEKNEKLKELDSAKSRFFANISHEFRTPLTLILAPIEFILKGKYKMQINYNDRIFVSIQNNINRLLRLINNLLDYTKIEDGRMNLIKNNVDMIKMLTFCINSVKSAAKSKNLFLTFKNKCNTLIANIDNNLMEKVIFNLISNAIKFTPSGGKISIELKKVNNNMVIVFKDTGIGIEKEKSNYIFERFNKIENFHYRKYEGTGIGLSLTKEIIELHGGRITVESEINKGSTFKVSIPFSDISKNSKVIQYDSGIELKHELIADLIEENSENIDSEENDNQERKNIFIVEDSNELKRYLISRLKKFYNVYTADDGSDALDKIVSISKPDIIISDIIMPRMDGKEFFKKIKNDMRFNDIPFVFLTGRADIDEKVKTLEDGAIDFIYKPFTIDEIVAKINSIIKSNDLQKKLIKDNIMNKIYKVIKFENSDKDSDFKHNTKIYEEFNITGKEKKVIDLLIDGKEYKEISSMLSMPISTIKKQIHNIYKKYNVSNRIELMKFLNKETFN